MSPKDLRHAVSAKTDTTVWRTTEEFIHNSETNHDGWTVHCCMHLFPRYTEKTWVWGVCLALWNGEANEHE